MCVSDGSLLPLLLTRADIPSLTTVRRRDQPAITVFLKMTVFGGGARNSVIQTSFILDPHA